MLQYLLFFVVAVIVGIVIHFLLTWMSPPTTCQKCQASSDATNVWQAMASVVGRDDTKTTKPTTTTTTTEKVTPGVSVKHNNDLVDDDDSDLSDDSNF
jgi:hypothetical protein